MSFPKDFHNTIANAIHIEGHTNAPHLLNIVKGAYFLDQSFITLLSGGMVHATSPMSYYFSSLPCYILIYTNSGEGVITNSNHTYRLSSETMLLYNSEEPFHINITSSTWDFIGMYITGDAITHYYNILLGHDLPYHTCRSSNILPCLQKLYSYTEIDTMAKALTASKLLTDILTEACVLSLNQNSLTEHIPSYLIDMKNLLTESYGQQISLNDLEEHFQISKYRLCREFTQYFHISPIHYLNNYRIEISKNLLLTTNMQVHEIGAAVGIVNTNHFITLFKKNTGVTPLVYKQDASASIRVLHSPYKPDDHLQS